MPRSGRRSRRCHAVETPVKPPPTIATSAVDARRAAARPGRGGSLSATHTERFSSGRWSRTPVIAYPSPRRPRSPPGDPVMSLGTRVRLCLKDLYAQDVVEMIERETRKYEVEAIEHPDHPDFKRAYQMLWDAFGAVRRDGARGGDPRDDARRLRPTRCRGGTYARYFLLVARDRATGTIRGVRDGRVLVNPAYGPDLCVVYLSHIFMLPEARGTVLTYWLRIAPLDLAVSYLHMLHQRGKIALPAPDAPGKYFGMRVDLAAEMEYFTPDDKLSLQRILFYGRGGFDAIDPRHFPYRQPDFREPELIARTGDRPVPVHAAAAPRRPRARGAAADRRGARGDAAAVRRLRDLLRAESTSRSSLDVVLGAARGAARDAARTTWRCCRCRPARTT